MPERYRLCPRLRVTPSSVFGAPGGRIRPWTRHPGGVTDIDVEPPVGASTATPPRRRIDPTLLIVSLVVGLGLTLVIRGLLIGVTGDERADLPDAVEEVLPVPEAEQALSQTNVFVDLETGYTGVFVIDGVEIPTVNIDELSSDTVDPGAQIAVPPVTVYEPGNATLTFTPGSDAPITEFGEGEHQVTVRYWRIDEGPQRARTYSWTFNVI